MNETSCKLMHNPDPHNSTFHCATCSCFLSLPRLLRAVEHTKMTFLHLQRSRWARQMVYHYEILYFHVLLSRVSCYFHSTIRVRGTENICYLFLIVLNILVIPNAGIFFFDTRKEKKKKCQVSLETRICQFNFKTSLSYYSCKKEHDK